MDIAVRVRRALGKGAVADVVLALIRQDGLSLRQLHRRSSYGPDEVCEAVSALKAGQMVTQRDGRLTLRGRDVWVSILSARSR